jgi:hypothetical protein
MSYHNTNINEAEIFAKWSPIIENNTTIKDKSKVTWLSKYCHFHELYEDRQLNESNSYALTSTVNGMGATRFPGSPGLQGDFPTQSTGSGDKAHSLLPLAMQVAAQTIAFDLLPVVPMPGPMGVLTYLDYVYGNGKTGSTGINVPEMIKAVGPTTDLGVPANPAPIAFSYIGKSRIDGKSVYRVLGSVPGNSTLQAQFNALTVTTEPIELVKALEDHVPGFSGGNYGAPVPYSREAGENTMDNVMNLTLFNKSVQAETFQVAAAVTREQVQDLKQFGIDAVSQIESVLINELTQSINKNILYRMFELGDRNHAKIIASQGVNFFLHLAATASTVGTEFGNRFQHVPNLTVINPTENVNSASENLHTRQRKIMSKIHAMATMISIRGRRGAGNFAVVCGKVSSALQDVSGFMAAPFANTINQNSGSLYPSGQLGGVTIYCDPNMDWNDARICVGRKGDGNSPGLVFMPYLIAETVQTIAEGTMAPKLAIKSRYALVEAGQHPETMYITSGVSIDPALGDLI